MLSVDAGKTALTSGTPTIRVGMALDRPLHLSARALREAETLASAGYDVYLLCPRTDGLEAIEERRGPLTIYRPEAENAVYRIPLLNKNTRAPMEGWMYRAALRLWNLDTVWQSLMQVFVARYDLQILHVHELPLVNTGMSVANKFQIPLVADLDRYYPAWVEARGKNGVAPKLRARWEDLESVGAYGADQVIVSNASSRARLLRKGTPEYKILVLPDFPDLARYETVPIDSEVIRRFKSTFLMTYAGPVGEPYSGLETVLAAMQILRDEIPELQLVCVGELSQEGLEAFHHQVNHAELAGRVHICRDLSTNAALVSCIEAADICLYPVDENDWTRSHVPEEIYLYQSFRKPVIASAVGEIKTYLEETESGLLARDTQALTGFIRLLYEDADARRRLGGNGLQAIREQKEHRKSQLGALLTLYRELSLPLVQYGARQ